MSIQRVASIDPVWDTQAPFPTSRINFIPTKIGKKSPFVMNLTNHYDYPITFRICCESDQFKISTKEITLDPNQKKKFTVTFAPTKEGTWFSMVIFHQSPGGEQKFFTVTGRGIK